MASFIETYGGNLNTMSNSGMAAVQRALDAGLTINQIRNQAAREGVSFGTRAREFLAARPSSSFIAQYGGNEATMRNSGLAAVRRAQQAGLSINDIRNQAAQEGVSFGVGAQSAFTSYDVQNQLKQQQQMFKQQLAEQQRQAQEAQRQLMINMQRGDRAPAAVKTAASAAEKSGLTGRGTTGYFGRRGMRIGSLNVPSTGLSISPNAAQMPTSGSFA